MDTEKLKQEVLEIQRELIKCIYPLDERKKTLESINDLSESIKDNSFEYKREAVKIKNILTKKYYIYILIIIIALFILSLNILKKLIMIIFLIWLFILIYKLLNK